MQNSLQYVPLEIGSIGYYFFGNDNHYIESDYISRDIFHHR